MIKDRLVNLGTFMVFFAGSIAVLAKVLNFHNDPALASAASELPADTSALPVGLILAMVVLGVMGTVALILLTSRGSWERGSSSR